MGGGTRNIKSVSKKSELVVDVESRRNDSQRLVSVIPSSGECHGVVVSSIGKYAFLECRSNQL